MLLRATVRDKCGDDYVRTVDIQSAKDFDKVGRAAFTWARNRARAMGAYAPTARVALTLQLEWVETAPALTNGATAAPRKGKHARTATRSRR